jgi:hypothetical protein
MVNAAVPNNVPDASRTTFGAMWPMSTMFWTCCSWIVFASIAVMAIGTICNGRPEACFSAVTIISSSSIGVSAAAGAEGVGGSSAAAGRAPAVQRITSGALISNDVLRETINTRLLFG